VYVNICSNMNALTPSRKSCVCAHSFWSILADIVLYFTQLIFSIKSQGGEVVASPVSAECKIVAGSKRYCDVMMCSV